MDSRDIDGIFDGLLSVFPVFAKKIQKIGDDVLKNEEISRAHAQLMRCLKNEGSCTMTDLGRMLYVSKPNITTLVDKLVDLDMVKRTFDKNDRRVTYIELTDKGCEFLEELMKSMKANVCKSMQKFTIDDLSLFEETIKKMKMLIDKIE